MDPWVLESKDTIQMVVFQVLYGKHIFEHLELSVSLNSCYLKCGSQTNSPVTSWELVRNAEFQAPTQTH